MNGFNPPPNWPVPPQDWMPPTDWEPDPRWGPPPPGWDVWPTEPRYGRAVALGLLGAFLGWFVASVAFGVAGAFMEVMTGVEGVESVSVVFGALAGIAVGGVAWVSVGPLTGYQPLSARRAPARGHSLRTRLPRECLYLSHPIIRPHRAREPAMGDPMEGRPRAFAATF